MVRRALILLLAWHLALPLAAASQDSPGNQSSTAQSLSPTAAAGTDADFPATPATPRSPKLGKNDPAEDFLVVTVISLPFMGLYALLGATIVAMTSTSNHNFPPDYNGNLITTAAAVAVGASFTIAAVSVNWGGGGKKEEAKKEAASVQEKK